MSVAQSFADDLDGLLAEHADSERRAWWERYLKGEARFRGVQMADTRAAVQTLVVRYGIAEADARTFLEVAGSCFRRPDSEDKIAGALLLAEHGLDTLTIEHVGDLAAPLAADLLADWNTCDWYCVKVVGPFVAAGSDLEARARVVADWRQAPGLWQRRAAAVAFVGLAAAPAEPFDGFVELMLEICRTNTADPTRWSQTSVGWLLRELAHARPEQVLEFLEQHDELSTEARRNARKHL